MLRGKKQRLFMAAAVFLLVAALGGFTACGNGNGNGNGNGGGAGEAGGQTGLEQYAGANFIILTGSSGSVWNLFGGQAGELLTAAVPGTTVNIEPGGAVSNYTLVNEGDAQFGLSTTDTSYEAWHGEGENFEALGELRNVRSFGIAYPMLYHWIATDKSGIETIYDIKGKTFTDSFPGQSSYIIGVKALALHGIDQEKDIKYKPGAIGEAVTAMGDGQLDGLSWNLSIPQATISELAVNKDVHMIQWGEGKLDEFLTTYPMYKKMTIPAGTYPFLTEDYETCGVVTDLICSADLDEELVYAFTKALWENREKLLAVSPTVEYMTMENAMADLTIPLHAGAYRYYTEAGCDVPDRLRPVD